MGPSVSRRGTCDRGIWTKSLVFAANAEEVIFLYGFSMAISPFDRLEHPNSQIVEAAVKHDGVHYRSKRESRSRENSPPTSTR